MKVRIAKLQSFARRGQSALPLVTLLLALVGCSVFKPKTVEKIVVVTETRDSIIIRDRIVHDTTYLRDTLHTIDSVLVDVPISEKGYASENYRVTIRGYRAEMTDIWIRQKETFVAVPYRKHWGWTLGPQGGVGITPKGVQPYAGFGVTFGYSF